MNPKLIHLAKVIGKKLLSANLTLALSESMTGGRLSRTITAIPGSSKYFLGSVVAYSNDSKIFLLGVSKNSLDSFGAVSPEIAREMAVGAKKVFLADIAISTTGIAGPSGGTKSKVVGTCFIGLAVEQSPALCFSFKIKGNREEIQNEACLQALRILEKQLSATQ